MHALLMVSCPPREVPSEDLPAVLCLVWRRPRQPLPSILRTPDPTQPSPKLGSEPANFSLPYLGLGVRVVLGSARNAVGHTSAVIRRNCAFSVSSKALPRLRSSKGGSRSLEIGRPGLGLGLGLGSELRMELGLGSGVDSLAVEKTPL